MSSLRGGQSGVLSLGGRVWDLSFTIVASRSASHKGRSDGSSCELHCECLVVSLDSFVDDELVLKIGFTDSKVQE